MLSGKVNWYHDDQLIHINLRPTFEIIKIHREKYAIGTVTSDRGTPNS